jgi:hypothetical protein
MENTKRFFHYTTETRLEKIIQSEIISLATIGIDNKREKPCAWVSSNPKWEHTATKMTRNHGVPGSSPGEGAQIKKRSFRPLFLFKNYHNFQ